MDKLQQIKLKLARSVYIIKINIHKCDLYVQNKVLFVIYLYTHLFIHYTFAPIYVIFNLGRIFEEKGGKIRKHNI